MRYYGVRALLSVDAADQAGPMIAGLPGPGVARVASAIVQAVLALRDDRVLDAAREVATAAVAEVDDSWDDVRPDVLELAAVVASRCQDHQRALVLAGAAEHCRERNGVAYRWRDQQRWLDDALAGATAQLGADETGAALARGAVLDIDEAMGIVRRGAGERRRPASGWDSLTPAEHQVCDLLADGLTNPQIAERLLMSRATVKTHISHCLTKLGMSTRSEIAAEVVRRGR